MVKSREVESRVLTLTAVCEYCNREVSLTYENVRFHGGSYECELCGEHGDVSMDATCPECDKRIEVVLAEW